MATKRENFVQVLKSKITDFTNDNLDDAEMMTQFQEKTPDTFADPAIQKAQKEYLEENVANAEENLIQAVRISDLDFSKAILQDETLYGEYKTNNAAGIFMTGSDADAAKAAYEKAQAELKAFNDKLNADAAIEIAGIKAAAPKAEDTAEEKKEAGAKTENPEVKEGAREYIPLFGNKNIFEAFLNNFVYNPEAAFPNYVFLGQFAIIGTAMMNSSYQASIARTSERNIEAELKKIEKSGAASAKVAVGEIRSQLAQIKILDAQISEITKKIKAAKGDVDSNDKIKRLQKLKNESKTIIKGLVDQVTPASNTILKNMERAATAREESAKLSEGLGGATLQALGNVVKVVAVGTVVLAPAVLAMGGLNLGFEGGAGEVQKKLCEVNEKKDKKDQNWALQEVSAARKNMGTEKNATDPNTLEAGLTVAAVSPTNTNSMALNIGVPAGPVISTTNSSGSLISPSTLRRASSVADSLSLDGSDDGILPPRLSFIGSLTGSGMFSSYSSNRSIRSSSFVSLAASGVSHETDSTHPGSRFAV